MSRNFFQPQKHGQKNTHPVFVLIRNHWFSRFRGRELNTGSWLQRSYKAWKTKPEKERRWWNRQEQRVILRDQRLRTAPGPALGSLFLQLSSWRWRLSWFWIHQRGIFSAAAEEEYANSCQCAETHNGAIPLPQQHPQPLPSMTHCPSQSSVLPSPALRSVSQ